MRRVCHYNIEKESIEDMIADGRFNPALKVSYWSSEGQHTHLISAGKQEAVDINKLLKYA